MSGGAKGGAKGGSPAPAPMAESLRSRWRRRSRTIPVMVGATVVGVVGLPVITVAAVVADIARGRFRFPSLRVALFLLQYGLNDCAEIVVAPVLWLWAGCGSRLSGQASMRRHEAVQAWSLTVLARRAESLLGLRVATDDEIVASLRPGPVIVLCCHVNLVDASLPSLLYLRLRYRTRGVIMAELLAVFRLPTVRLAHLVYKPADRRHISNHQIAPPLAVDGTMQHIIHSF